MAGFPHPFRRRRALLAAPALALSLALPHAQGQTVETALPDPRLLPVATTSQIPLTAAYNALRVTSLAAGGHYLDPTTLVKVHKITSATFPASSPRWGHDYSEGGDEVSLPYDGSTRAVLVRQNGGSWWLVDFTPGVGVDNPRPLTGSLAPLMDLAFTFSNNPATPYYAYVSGGSVIRRIDIRTMSETPGGGWPVTGETNACWLHQSENDAFFTWMRGANGSTIVGYEPGSGTRKTYTSSDLNEPRIDRAGRYVGVSMAGNGLVVWDWLTNSVAWTTPGDPGIPFAHNASLKRRWMSVDWNMSYPPDYTVFVSDTPNSAAHADGPANGTLIHGNGNWIQHPADLDDQWAVFLHYGSLRPAESYWLAPGGMVLVTPNGERRLLAHPYNTTSDYAYFSFAKFSPDGRYVMFTSDMNGSGRSDVFLAELPGGSDSDTSPPSVAVTAPATGAVVSGGAVAVSASASDDVGVAGVRFQLDGFDIGDERTSAPYAVSWDSLSASNGPHWLTARARDAAGNWTDSAGVGVTVSNLDATPPVISWASADGVTASEATITWTTDEAADSQVDYGTGPTWGLASPLDPGLVTSHTQRLLGLAADTTYHYRLRSRDAAGNLAVSGDYVFTTRAAAVGGLVAHLALDEGTGRVASDATGGGHDGTLIGGAAWASGRFGQAVELDGADGLLSVPHSPALDAFPLSVSVWFRARTTTGVRGIVNKYAGGSYDGYQIFLNKGRLCAWYLRDASSYVYDGGGCTLGVAGLNDGQWHHAVFVVDLQGGRLFVDGSLRGTQPWTGEAGAVTTSQDLRLGHYPGAFGGAEFLRGVVDDLRVYDRALSAAEIAALFAGVSGPEPVRWINQIGVTADGNSLVKTGGCDGCADAGARSEQEIAAGDGYVELTASETWSLRYIGLSNGDPGTSGSEIAFALRLQSGWVEVRESGVYIADAPLATGDTLRVAVEGGVVRYHRNGVPFYASTRPPSYPLLVDTSIYTANGTLSNVLIRR